MPRHGTITDNYINILLEEIQQALAWSRPSILIAVHQSKNDQAPIITATGSRLKHHLVNVVDVISEGGSVNILDKMLQEPNFQKAVFFVHGMGGQLQVYDGLNMFRELVVEQRLKIIFWLTREELNLLARHAPDFWAFRHRVIEFPAVRRSLKNIIPSGALLWRFDNSILDEDTVHEKIAFHEKFIHNFSQQDETVTSYLRELESLSYYYWLLGENQKVDSLIYRVLERFDLSELGDLHSMLLNVQAINCFDQGDFQGAHQRIEQALELSPDQGMLWANYGIICRFASQARKSFPSLKKSVSLNPVLSKGWDALGYMYMFMGKFAFAIPNFEKAISMEPDALHSRLAVAACYSRMGNRDELNTILQHISNVSDGNGYLLACRSGLFGDVSGALTQLKEWVLAKGIPKVLLRRDPALHFIFGAAPLQLLL